MSNSPLLRPGRAPINISPRAFEESTMLIDDILPRHGHRTPAELAEDEVLAALRGDGIVSPVRRCSPDRREVVTFHSSRLFPVRLCDCVTLKAKTPEHQEVVSREAARMEAI